MKKQKRNAPTYRQLYLPGLEPEAFNAENSLDQKTRMLLKKVIPILHLQREYFDVYEQEIRSTLYQSFGYYLPQLSKMGHSQKTEQV